MFVTLTALNIFAALGEAVAALIHLFAPTLLYPGLVVSQTFVTVTWLFVIRNLVLTLAVLYCTVMHRYRFLPGLCLIMGLIQLADSVLGVVTHNPGMIIAPFVAALIHLSYGYFLNRIPLGKENIL